MQRTPIGYVLLKIAVDHPEPVPAVTEDRLDGFSLVAEAEAVADIAAQLNGTSTSGLYAGAVEAYRATQLPGDRYLVGAVIRWQ